MKTLVIACVLMLSGCCSLCPDKVKEVYVKTGCLPPPVVVAPTLRTAALTEKSTYRETVEAYVFDNLALVEYSNQLLTALSPYKSCEAGARPSQ